MPQAAARIDLRLDPDLTRFRGEIREFLAAEMHPDRTRSHGDPTDLTGLDVDFEAAHQRRAGELGYLGISVPTEFGGGGRPPSWKAIWMYEAAYHDAPSIDTALTLCAAPMLSFASPEQRQRFLPPMVRGETLWAIAYSEHDAGSDLTALSATAAISDGGGFVLNGTKALVTGSHKADWCITIARTDPDASPRRGLSMFVVDLSAPGVELIRRETANGWTLGEITFHDVRLDADALLGELNGGWRQLSAAVIEERSGTAWLGWAARILDDLDRWATDAVAQGDAPAETPAVLAELRAELAGGYRLAERLLALADEAATGTAEPDATHEGAMQASMTKVWATELLQRIARAAFDLVGTDAIVWAPLFGDDPPPVAVHGRTAYELIERIHPTISVGANELQRDTIARALGVGVAPKQAAR